MLHLRRPLLSLAAAGLAVLTPFAVEGADHHEGDGAQEEHEDEVLHESMEALNTGLRELRGLMRAGEVDPMLPVLDGIQAAVVAGKGATPATIAAVPEAQQAAFLRDFRAEQLELLSKLVRVEELLLEGDVEAANTHLNEEVMSMKRGAHQRFKTEGGWTPR